jgi:hypothetical protein
MSQSQLLKEVVGALDSAAIPYMLTGSIVSSLQGEPRATHDIDIVVLISENDIEKLLPVFAPPRYFLDPDSIREALACQGMFNVIDLSNGDKVDFWMLTDEPFDHSRFARRQQQVFLDFTIMVSQPEDTILSKLKWAKLCGGSEKQFADALRIYEVQYGILNHDYLSEWVEKLNLKELWERLQQEAEIVE